jgi:hypothetical protein
MPAIASAMADRPGLADFLVAKMSGGRADADRVAIEVPSGKVMRGDH